MSRSLAHPVKPWAALVMAAIVTAAVPASACDLCAIYTGSLMQKDKTGLLLGVAEQYTSFGSIREDNHHVPNEANEWIHSSITQLIAGYAFTPRIGVQANIPFISREYRRLEEGAPVRGDAGGLGDISLLARANPFSRAVGDFLLHAEVLAGLKVPTGNSDRLGEELLEAPAIAAASPRHADPQASAVHGHDLAPGSGSVDGVFGASFHASRMRAFGDIAVQYIVRGNGDFSYEYANDLTWEAAAGCYFVTQDAWTASARLVTSGENKGRDHQHGHLEGDTAITAVYLGPGITATWSDSLHADLVIEGPLVEDTTGRQLVADYRVRAGVVWRF